jgi:hypothetical protein
MATLIVRPIKNVKKSWSSSDYSNIDDVVTYPDIDGTADYNRANKNDDNEVEKYGCTTIDHAIVSDIEIYMLARALNTAGPLTGNYNIGGSSGVAKTWTVALTNWVWYTDSWTGLSLPMNRICEIWPGAGAMGSSGSDYLDVAVAYLKLTYTLGPYHGIQGGNIQGGNIR